MTEAKNMRTVFMLTLMLICGSSYAVVLIDQNTRNGSFETGALEPWSRSRPFDPANLWGLSSDFNVVHNALIASDGDYFSVLEGTFTWPSIDQWFPVDKSLGSVFTFSIDIRSGANSFDGLYVSLGGLTYGLEGVHATLYEFEIPDSAKNEWITFAGTATFEDLDWQELDPEFICFDILLAKNDSIGDVAYQGFLDNIVLTQIPEPGCLALFSIGAVLLLKKKK